MIRELLALLCVFGCVDRVVHGNETGYSAGESTADAHQEPRKAGDPGTASHDDLEAFMRLVRSIVEETPDGSPRRASSAKPRVSATANSFKELFAPVSDSNQEVRGQPSSVRVGRKIIPTYLPSIFGQGDESLFSLIRKVKKAMTDPVDQDRDLKSVLGRSVFNFILPNKDGNKLNMGSTWQVLSTLYKSLNNIDLLNKFIAL